MDGGGRVGWTAEGARERGSEGAREGGEGEREMAHTRDTFFHRLPSATVVVVHWAGGRACV